MLDAVLLIALLLVPSLAAPLSLLMPSVRAALGFVILVTVGLLPIGLIVAGRVVGGGPIGVAGNWLYADALSAFYLVVMLIVVGLSSVFAWSYFADEIRRGELSRKAGRRFAALWLGAHAAMTLVLLSNNLGMQWVGIEATTLLTAFLIYTRPSAAALEATWKYLLICSVGVAFAFIGILLVAAAAEKVAPNTAQTFLWTELMVSTAALDPTLLKAGFIFLLVGYGTKVGLAPLHNWLPDAHSQAPAPVSAIFSGFLLNAAMYCLLRYVPLVERTPGLQGFATGLLVFFGLLSILVAATFILFQQDAKRLLAYSSIEHLGIVALGLGLGGLGVFAALFHTLNHSLAKSLAFFATGRLGQAYGTHEMSRLGRTLKCHPVWGLGLLVSLLALIGVAPFSIFMSELLVVRAAADNGAYWTLGLFLAGTAVVFIGALRQAVNMAWGGAAPSGAATPATAVEVGLVVVAVALLLLLGLWLPAGIQEILAAASGIVGGRP
jgi:hydrogenase-4 component F